MSADRRRDPQRASCRRGRAWPGPRNAVADRPRGRIRRAAAVFIDDAGFARLFPGARAPSGFGQDRRARGVANRYARPCQQPCPGTAAQRRAACRVRENRTPSAILDLACRRVDVGGRRDHDGRGPPARHGVRPPFPGVRLCGGRRVTGPRRSSWRSRQSARAARSGAAAVERGLAVVTPPGLAAAPLAGLDHATNPVVPRDAHPSQAPPDATTPPARPSAPITERPQPTLATCKINKRRQSAHTCTPSTRHAHVKIEKVADTPLADHLSAPRSAVETLTTPRTTVAA